jgi:hypothetical protein
MGYDYQLPALQTPDIYGAFLRGQLGGQQIQANQQGLQQGTAQYMPMQQPQVQQPMQQPRALDDALPPISAHLSKLDAVLLLVSFQNCRRIWARRLRFHLGRFQP